uniref:aralkylamine N-acetyltransferase n=1 Tax=Acrobeloides nanus TaxID=290746 RepID=A0A914EIU4_9BILA
MDFLVSMNKVCNDHVDPRYEHITYEDMIELDKIIGRHISLEEGIQHPEYVCPRTKNKFTCERVFRIEDIRFYWYRIFVMCADFANLIPQFRELPLNDQCQLFRLNFGVLSWSIYMEFIVYSELTIGYPMGNGSYAPWNLEEIEAFLKLYNAGDTLYKPKKQAMEDYKTFVRNNMIEPIKSLELDKKELCLLKVILLFQQEEHLSDLGREISHKTNNLLFDTFWDYQSSKYPDLSFDEKLRRHSRFLLLSSKIGQAWHMECDIHLLMSILGNLKKKSMGDEYEIVDATQQDFDGIMKFLMSDFLYAESLNAALKLTEEEAHDFFAELVESTLKDPVSYLAKTSDGEIIGLNLSCIMKRPTQSNQEEDQHHESVFLDNTSALKPEKVQKIGRFVGELESRIWELVPPGVDTLLSVVIISISKNYTRRGIAKKLVEHRLDRAEELGCQGVFTELSALASQKLFKKLGFEELYVIEHENWKENGERVFYCPDGTDRGILAYKPFSTSNYHPDKNVDIP